MFLAEDPDVFAARVAQVYLKRYQASLKLKLDFYVDCMPTDETTGQLSDDQIKSIMNRSGMNGKHFKNLQGNNSINLLIKEMCLEYARASNYMVFMNEIKGLHGHRNYPSIELPFEEPPAPTPEYGKAVVPKYDFEGLRQAFGFASLMTRVEVIRTLAKVRVECDKLANTILFATNITKTVKLDEFEQLQTQALQNVKGSLKDG